MGTDVRRQLVALGHNVILFLLQCSAFHEIMSVDIASNHRKTGVNFIPLLDRF